MGMSQNFYDRNSSIKEINKREIANSQQNFAFFFFFFFFFFQQQQIQNIKLFKYYIEKDKTKFGQNCHR